jgi:CRP/FNR family transcriptional regulator, cyclic AMP receptor protein
MQMICAWLCVRLFMNPPRSSQQVLTYSVGLSRQRVNEALSTLQARGLVRLEYGGLKVLDIAALRTTVFD